MNPQDEARRAEERERLTDDIKDREWTGADGIVRQRGELKIYYDDALRFLNMDGASGDLLS